MPGFSRQIRICTHGAAVLTFSLRGRGLHPGAVALSIFEYLEIRHNRRRRRSAPGWLAPIEFENRSPIVVA
jgi:hypothetical protein